MQFPELLHHSHALARRIMRVCRNYSPVCGTLRAVRGRWPQRQAFVGSRATCTKCNGDLQGTQILPFVPRAFFSSLVFPGVVINFLSARFSECLDTVLASIATSL